MSQEHRAYHMKQRARQDPHQMVFKGGGIDKNPGLYTVVESSMAINPKKKVTCPFCLGLSEFRLFLVSTKKGISTNNAKCPLCGLSFRMGNLVGMTKWTAKEYAKWVYEYSKQGFWSKVNSVGFNTWKGRLKLMGWIDDFWTAYGELKGSEQEEGGDTESFQDYVNRKSQEAAEEWKKEDQTTAPLTGE